MSSTFASAEPFLIAAGYATAVGILGGILIKKVAKHRANERPRIELPGGTPENYVAFSLWAVDLFQVITTAILSPLIGYIRDTGSSGGIGIVYLATVITSVALCVVIASQDPVEYVNWADLWIKKRSRRKGRPETKPSIVMRAYIHIATALGITWPTLIQLVAAGVAAYAASGQRSLHK